MGPYVRRDRAFRVGELRRCRGERLYLEDQGL
jgi:hypothetical protein